MPLATALMTAIYPTPDLARAKTWYRDAFGVEPYFDQPFYVGFDIGGFELGLVPEEPVHRSGNRGVVAYWGVPDADAAWSHLAHLGAKPLDPIKDVGDGIRVALVEDPFGNAIGLIQNPNFKVGK